MKRGRSINLLPWLSVGFLLIAVALTITQLVTYSRIRMNFAPGTVIAGVPVGGMSQQQAGELLLQAFNIPVEVRYGDAIIHIKPAVVGFEPDLNAMLTAADQQRVSQPFWQGFWNYLWNRLPAAAEVPLRATLSEDRLRAYLKDEIAARYDRPAAAAMPVPGSVTFQSGNTGTTLDVDRAVVLIGDALRSPTARVVNLSVNRVSATRPTMQNLQILLQQVLDTEGFDGVAEMYIQDLTTNQEIHFAYSQGKNYPPNIAFSAESTIKIPIMMSIFRRINEPAPKEVTDLIELMIERSENGPPDTLMQNILDLNLGPLVVTDDLQTLGLKNTFLTGYLYLGAPRLKDIQTAANTRTDIYTDPDPYSQTTPAEMGMLMNDIYECAQTGGGTLVALFPGQITQNECRLMITYMTRNRIGVLIEAGVPEGTQVAHKHGWSVDATDGLMHTIGDVAIVFSPGGNYIYTVFLWHPSQLVWDPANKLVARLSTAVYNYFNLK